MDIIQIIPSDPFMVVAAGLSALFAGLLVLIAWQQLNKIVDANSEQASVATATLLLEIDNMFEGPEILESRQAIRTLRNSCEALAEELTGDDRQKQAQIAEELFSKELDSLLTKYKKADQPPKPGEDQATGAIDSAAAAYTKYMRLPYWMETVALMAQRQLISKEVVLDLYDEVFATTLSCFVKHIDERRKAGPTPNPRFLKNATDFRTDAIEHKQKREAELLGSQKQSSNRLEMPTGSS